MAGKFHLMTVGTITKVEKPELIVGISKKVTVQIAVFE